MKNTKFAGIILAAGFSSRMGALKPLLPLGEDTILNKLIKCYKDAGVEHVFVVTGFEREKIETGVRDAVCVHNPDYEQGMITSIKAGLKKALEYDWDGVMFMPVDHAMIRPFMLKLMMNEFSADEDMIIFPVYKSRRGHPPVLCRSVAKDLSVYDGERGAKRFLFERADIAHETDVHSSDLFADMDTREDYEKMKITYLREIPTEEECYAMLKAEKTPENVICHCRAVAAKAIELTSMAQKAGCSINGELVYTSALLHDIARTEKDHAKRGGEILRQNGFFRVADIIENHMDICSEFAENITEESIVYLADKLTEDTEYISLGERLEKMPPEKAVFAKEKLKKAEMILNRIKV